MSAPITVRPVQAFDTRAMASLLNSIIAKGGTTALTRPVTGEDIAERIANGGEHAAWHVAVSQSGEILGFQWIQPMEYLPKEATDIATFVQIGQTGLGIGSALFEQTKTAAKALGYRWINANIRADNDGGLIYYQSRGFRDYDRWDDYQLDNGDVVSKILKRFDLY